MKVTADRVINLSAIVISLGTLSVIFYQTNLMRKEQEAVVMPYLSIAYSQGVRAGQEYQQIHVTTQGLGPAKVESIRVINNGQVLEGGPYKYFRDNTDTLNVLHGDIVTAGRLIAANDRVIMLSLDNEKYKNDIIETFKFSEVLQSFTPGDHEPATVLEIVYSSVYGTKWVSRSDESIPRLLED